MRTTSWALLLSFTFGLAAQAADTFEMALPEEQVSGPSSGGFVDSFQKDLNSSRSTKPASAYQPPANSAPEEEAPKGAYENAFTSYQSKTPSEDQAVDQADAWRLGQEKKDNFDVENLSYTAPATSVPKKHKVQAKTQVRAKAQSRAPASATIDEIPMPEGAEFEASVSSPAAASVSPAVSAKDRKALIMKTIADNYGDLKGCYQEGLRKNSAMKGKVVMGWAMDPQGRVSGAEVQSSQLNNKQVEKCMVERLSGWHFPRQAKLQGSKDRMTYTFQFVPEHD